MAARKLVWEILLGAILHVAIAPPSYAASGNPNSGKPNQALEPHGAQDSNQAQDPNALSAEDAAILADFEFFALFDLLRNLHLFVESP